jgi:hypothetical protein
VGLNLQGKDLRGGLDFPTGPRGPENEKVSSKHDEVRRDVLDMPDRQSSEETWDDFIEMPLLLVIPPPPASGLSETASCNIAPFAHHPRNSILRQETRSFTFSPVVRELYSKKKENSIDQLSQAFHTGVLRTLPNEGNSISLFHSSKNRI